MTQRVPSYPTEARLKPLFEESMNATPEATACGTAYCVLYLLLLKAYERETMPTRACHCALQRIAAPPRAHSRRRLRRNDRHMGRMIRLAGSGKHRSVNFFWLPRRASILGMRKCVILRIRHMTLQFSETVCTFMVTPGAFHILVNVATPFMRSGPWEQQYIFDRKIVRT